MIDSDRAVALIQELIRIPSESSGQTMTDAAGPEQALVAYLAGLCATLGISHEVQEVSPGRPNFIALFPNPGAPRLLLVGHLDTVSSASMDEPFSSVIREEKIWGRGACDDKGPLSIALSTLSNSQLHMKKDAHLTPLPPPPHRSAGSERQGPHHP